MYYSIIIPVYNELPTLKKLLSGLKRFYDQNNEIIIIDDGSNDGSKAILSKCPFIVLINFKKNKGKGTAIIQGIKKSKYNKIIIYDGDLELKLTDISKLMILNKKKGLNNVIGYRFKNLSKVRSSLDWGNFMFTVFFNLLYRSCHKDILCCAKSFYKKGIFVKHLKSKGFDIDVELASIITTSHWSRRVNQVQLNYTRRTVAEGKKLKVLDGWIILKRIIITLIKF